MATMEQAFEMVENLTEELGEKEERIIALEKELLEHKIKSSQDIKKLFDDKELLMEHISYLDDNSPEISHPENYIEEFAEKLDSDRKYQHLSDNEKTMKLIQYSKNIHMDNVYVYTKEQFIEEVKDAINENEDNDDSLVFLSCDGVMITYMKESGNYYYKIPWENTEYQFIEIVF